LSFLIEHNLNSSNKTYEASLPRVKDPLCAKLLLRGLIDGDGNIRDGFRIYTASYKLKDDLVKHMQEHHQYEMIVTPTKTKKSGGFTISTRRDFFPKLIEIYQDFEDLRINRKKEILNKKVYDIVHSHKMINYGS